MIIFCVSPVSADMIQPGKKPIEISYKITNIDHYPEYVFLVYFFSPMVGYKEININEKITAYKFCNACIYAIKASEYRNLEIGKEDQDINQFFEQNNLLIRSNIELSFFREDVPEIDPLESQIILLEIELLTQTSLRLRVSLIQYCFSDGTMEEVTYRTTDVTPAIIYPSDLPEPLSRNLIWFWYAVVPLCALLGIVLVIRFVNQKDDT